jgi:hypothetical protein
MADIQAHIDAIIIDGIDNGPSDSIRGSEKTRSGDK